MKILTIVGARPQFIKAAMGSAGPSLEHNRQNASQPIEEEIIHAGQYYDDNMSDIFFKQMQIPGYPSQPLNLLLHVINNAPHYNTFLK